jgi:protein PhnA
MSIEKDLQKRSESKCEICSSTDNLSVYEVQPNPNGSADQAVYACETCQEQIDSPEKTDPNHWRCLNDSMWSQVHAVQVLAWRMLTRLIPEGWSQDLLDMLYLEDDVLIWAKSTGEGEPKIIHKDSNGVQLQPADSVTIIKDLNVKGTSFVAKRGTLVQKISLVRDNPEHIEGRVNGTKIVILTQYVKKS